MHNKLYPHYTIYFIFLFCRDMSWMLWFCVDCISARTWYKIQPNASTKTADRNLQHPLLPSYRLTETNQYCSSLSFRVICHSRNNTPVWKHIRYCCELLCNSDGVKEWLCSPVQKHSSHIKGKFPTNFNNSQGTVFTK